MAPKNFLTSRWNSPATSGYSCDTHLDLDYRAMLTQHLELGALISIATRRVADTQRYGSLLVEGGRVRGFREKGRTGAGEINGGIYLFERDLFDRYQLPLVFSFESDVLVSWVLELEPLAKKIAIYH